MWLLYTSQSIPWRNLCPLRLGEPRTHRFLCPWFWNANWMCSWSMKNKPKKNAVSMATEAFQIKWQEFFFFFYSFKIYFLSISSFWTYSILSQSLYQNSDKKMKIYSVERCRFLTTLLLKQKFSNFLQTWQWVTTIQ